MVCLVLSGGAARGLAHIGVYKFLYERGINVKAVAGSSAGAIVGAFISTGYTPEDMVKIAKETKPYKVFRPNFPPKFSLFSNEPIKDFFRNFLPAKFESLKVPLYVSTTELNSGRNRIFYKGDLIKAVMASSALPPFFEPVEIEGKYYNDGGFSNDLPVEPLKDCKCKKLCVDVTPVEPNAEWKPKNFVEITLRSFLIAIRKHKREKEEFCNFVIKPNLGDLGFINYLKVEEYVKRGYRKAEELLQNIL
jgi:NTE family protein